MAETPEDPREKQNRLLERLGSALLGLKAEIASLRQDTGEAHKTQIAQGNAHLTQIAIVDKQVETVTNLLAKLDQLPVLHAAVQQVSRDVDRAVGEARKEIGAVDDSLDGLRDDLTPTHGTQMPTKEEIDRASAGRTRVEVDAADDAEVRVGPVRVRERLLAAVGKALPWIVFGVLLGFATLAIALWASGERFGVVQRQGLSEPVARPGVLVPSLEKPHSP